MDQNILEELQKEIENTRLQADRADLSRQQQETYMQSEEKSMVKEQLDLSEHITRLDYLLKGYSLSPDSSGNLVWTKPVSEDLVVFSDYGIQMIMNTICFYLNQNTLLSNYKEDEIRRKMFDFTIELIDAIFMNYEKVFKYPTVQECIEVLKERIERKTTIAMYANKLRGIDADKTEIYKGKVKEIEDRIENEIEKVREQIIKEKLKRFPLLIRVIQDTVHSTYQRAWNGQERNTLRQHTHITESRGLMPQNINNQGGGLWRLGKKL